ncbi:MULTISPECIES: hypothetical protein [Staphylococcus]|uniref:hypothetical protein n=1 Tax=Staphylococcus TaxID=1279 RepID=UPI00143CD695|nr:MULTISPECIES: hypothetical protein [Staphylococcus]GGG95977.1 hypothetical protein GCM10007342_19230 [Staphylococcus pragensis]
MIKLDNKAKKIAIKALLKPSFLRSPEEHAMAMIYSRTIWMKIHKGKKYLM